jgi:hypothetical protein
MREHRGHQRFELLFRHDGLLRVVSAVDLVSADEEEVVVVADRASLPGEAYVFRGPPPGDGTREVCVAACRAVLEGDRLRYELRLSLDEVRRGQGADA